MAALGSATAGAAAALRGKVALVTGAAGVIGAAIAKDLAAAGVKVGLLDISAEGLAQVAAEIAAGTGSGDNGLVITCDLGDEASIAAAVATLKDAEGFGMPDILVNVAGILSNNKLAETTVEEWQRVMTINVQSAFLLCQHCCPVMAEKKWGRVVNITSWAWKSGGLTAGTAYSASKGAMTSLTFSVARQYVEDGVTCNGYLKPFAAAISILSIAATMLSLHV
jgi:3-oxoacyl-[acyl-carrier protein] reductase